MLFHYFDQFLAESESRFEKEYEVDPMVCLQCGATMKVIAFLTDYAVVDRIIHHLKLSFVADKPPPPQIAYQEVLMAADSGAEYFSLFSL